MFNKIQRVVQKHIFSKMVVRNYIELQSKCEIRTKGTEFLSQTQNCLIPISLKSDGVNL